MKNKYNSYGKAGHKYPVTSIRNELSTTAAALVTEEIELNLQFEDSEVFDIRCIETYIECNVDVAGAVPGNSNLDLTVAVNEIPNANQSPATAAVFETDQGIIYYQQESIAVPQATAVGDVVIPASFYKKFSFVHENGEPWTVARNLALMLIIAETGDLWNVADTTFLVRSIVWGNRRNAPAKEFQDIIYRQRF